MSLATNTAIDVFDSGGHADLTGTGTITAIADTQWSTINTTTGLVAWTNTVNAQRASITLKGATASAVASVGKYVDLYLRPINVINTTDDDNIPSDDFKQKHAGSFPMKNGQTAQQATIDIVLPNWTSSSEYEFYLNNESGQTLSADFELWIAPKGTGPVAV